MPSAPPNAGLRQILVRAGKSALADQITDSAAALAYYTFLAIPAALIVALGIFGLVASPSDVTSLVEHLRGTVPNEAITLIRQSLDRVTKSGGGSFVAVVIGFVLALYTMTGAMNALMRAVNHAYGLKETRSFIKQRLAALAMIALFLLAALLVVGLLVLGPVLSGKVGDWTGWKSVMGWIWWTAQWPVLLLGLLCVFAVIYVIAPDRGKVRIDILAPGTVLAVLVWLAASGGFSIYVATFASYNKTWGSLAGVIVLMTWLWLSSVAILLGAEVNAENEESRGTIPDHRTELHKLQEGKEPAAEPARTAQPARTAESARRGIRAPDIALTGLLAATVWALRGGGSKNG